MTHNVKGGEPFVDWNQEARQQPGAMPAGPINAAKLGRVIHDQLYKGGAQQFLTHEEAAPVCVPIKDPMERITYTGVLRRVLHQDLLALIRTPGNELFGAVRLSLEHDNAYHSAVVLSKVPGSSEEPLVCDGLLIPQAEVSVPFDESAVSVHKIQDPTLDAYQQPLPYWQVGVMYDPWQQNLQVQQYGAGSHLNTAVAIAGYELPDAETAPQSGIFGAAWATAPDIALHSLYSVYGNALQYGRADSAA
ncbi:MAG TPA: hypothetical protein VFI74_00420 [Candidatus Saccharimonadales bacterium]|nr:hypothetical protein [Candidatus Saccharimonadales bacterium]